MVLERDLFKVRFDKKTTNVQQLLKTTEKVGFPATVLTKPPAEIKPKDFSGQLPQFYLKALDRSRREKKPLVLDFGASWCIPCKKLEKETLANPMVARLLGQCIVLKVDTDKHPILAKHFRVAGMPDIRLLTPGGKPHRKLVGFQSTKKFAGALRALLKASSSIAKE